MTETLPAHVRLAVLGDDLVLMDVSADTYSCLPGGRPLFRPSVDRRSLSPPDAAGLFLLRDAGLLTVRRDTPRAALLPDLPGATAPPALEQLSLRSLLRISLCLWDVLTAYRGRTFSQILGHVAPNTPRQPAPPEMVLRLAAQFSRVLPWLPLPQKCLVRSFALLRFLRRSGVGATWVFGVRTWPFAAHCWVQLGDVALDDTPDRLAAYEPILAITG
jgi:hypothetical protein